MRLTLLGNWTIREFFAKSIVCKWGTTSKMKIANAKIGEELKYENLAFDCRLATNGMIENSLKTTVDRILYTTVQCVCAIF